MSIESSDSTLAGGSDNQAAAPAPAHASSTLRYRRPAHYATASLIGLAAGLVAVAFQYALHGAETSRERLLTALRHHMPVFGVLVLPAIGLVVGCLVGAMLKVCPESGGSGIPHLKGVLLGVRTLRWKLLLPIKFVGGVLGVGVGLSLGREGPTVQMGAAMGQAIARLLRVPAARVPQMLSAGAGAGLAAAFNAPLAGFLFVIEELHRELSARTFVGALIAAVVATAVTESLAGQVPSFQISEYAMLPVWALPAAVVVGIAGGLLGVAFNAALLHSQKLAQNQRAVPPWLLPGLSGVIVGVVAWWMPLTVGGGHDAAHRLLSGELAMPVKMLLAWLVVKFLMTVLSYGSGAPGGIFAPMLLLGAILGSTFGASTNHIAALAPYHQAFAVLGMAAVFVGSVRAPLTGIVLISEMTENYHQLFALCITCLSAHLTAEWLKAQPIYDALLELDLHRRGVKPAEEARTIYLGVQRDAPITGKPLRDVGLPRGALITAIERGGRSIVPLAHVELSPGDHITVSLPADTPELAMAVSMLCLPAD